MAHHPPARRAGQTFADPTEIIPATDLATAQLNAHAKAVGLGTATTTATTSPAPIHLPALRNAALNVKRSPFSSGAA
jgi:hypothetical protein